MIKRTLFNFATRIKNLLLVQPFSKTKDIQHEHDLLYGISPVEAALHANRRQFVSLMASDSDRIELSSRTAKLIHLAR
jgi:tRNA G18 (ribose-2'-O)-methylase SpoU